MSYQPYYSSPRGSSWLRRDFLKVCGGCAGMGTTSLLSSLLNLRMTQSVMAAQPDVSGYKALVCVFLYGGCDAYNLLTPYVDAEHALYATRRGGLWPDAIGTGIALPKVQSGTYSYMNVLPISGGGPGGTGGDVYNRSRQFGIHYKMPEIQALYNTTQKAAFIANIGTLVRPTTRTDYNSNKFLPKGLFSHADEQRNWQTALPDDRVSRKGWAGRIADLLQSQVSSSISLNIALNSTNVQQRGNNTQPYIISESSGAYNLEDYPKTDNTFNRIRNATTDSLVPQNATALNNLYADLLQRNYARNTRDSIDAANFFDSITATPNPALPYTESTLFPTSPSSSIMNQAKWVARSINARGAAGLNQSRQIFFINTGSFDHHDNLITGQENLLGQVSKAINALYQACVAMGVQNDVTIFTESDFNRTLVSNGDGSDHAWGSNVLVVGGSVKPGVYGRYPDNLNAPTDATAGSLDLGSGRLLPTTSAAAYSAELARWFGIPDDASNLEVVIPNIRNFVSQGSTPIGFLL